MNCSYEQPSCSPSGSEQETSMTCPLMEKRKQDYPTHLLLNSEHQSVYMTVVKRIQHFDETRQNEYTSYNEN